jgi:hypothetical protein
VVRFTVNGLFPITGGKAVALHFLVEDGAGDANHYGCFRLITGCGGKGTLDGFP